MDDLGSSRLLSLFDEMPARISCVSADGELRYCNRAHREYFCLGDDIPEGMTITEVVGKRDIDLQTPYIMRVLAGETVQFERSTDLIDRGREIASVTLIPDRSPDGEIIGYHSFATDVTEQSRARAAESMLADALQSVSEGVALYDTDDRLVFTNSITHERLGTAGGIQVGMRFEDVVRAFASRHMKPVSQAEVEDYVANRMAQHRVPKGAVEIRLGDGWLLAQENRTDAGGTLCIYTDITELKKRELALERADRRYATAADAAHTGVWEWDLNTGDFFADASLKRLIGYDDDEIGDTAKQWLSHVHPEDRGPLIEATDRHLAGETDAFAFEHRKRHKDGSERWFLSRGRALGESQNGERRLIGADVDITERKQAEKRLRESEERYRTLLEAIPEGMVVTRGEGIIFANSAAGRMHGFESPEDLAGKHLWELLHPSERDRTLEDKEAVFDRREPYISKPYRHVRCDNGEEIVTEDSGYPITWQGQNSALVVMRDVTERRLAEQALLESEERYRTLVSLLPDAIIVSQKGKVVFANQGAAALHGAKSPDGLIGLAYNELVHPDYRADVDVRRKLLGMRDRPIPLIEHTHIRVDNGEEFMVEKNGQGILWQGEPASLVVIRDITERKKAQRALQESEQRYRTLVDLLPDAVIVGQNETVIFANQGAAAMHGADSADDLIGRPYNDLIHPDFHADVGTRQQLIHSGQLTPLAEHVHKRLDTGEDIHVEKISQGVQWQGQRAALVVVRDITARTRAERALRENEAQLRLITDGVPALIAYIDRDERIQFANRQYAEWLKLPRERIIGAMVRDVIDQGEYEASDANRKKVLAGSEVSFEGLHQDGDTLRQYRATYIPHFDEDGTVQGYFALIVDITEENRLSEALRESEAQLRLITDSVPAMICYVDRDEKLRFINRQYAAWMGQPLDRVVGSTVRDVIGETEYEATNEQRRKAYAGDEVTFEGRRLLGGIERYYRSSFIPHLDEANRVQGYFGLILDITEEMRLSEALRKSEEGYRNLFEAIPEGILVSDGAKIIFANPAAAEIHGAESSEQLIGANFKDLLHPDHYAENEENRKLVVEQRGQFETREFKHVRLDDGQVIYTEDNGHNILWRGEPAGLIVIRDVSDRRAAESALREREAHLSLIMDNAPAMIGYIEPDGRYRYVSRRYEEWFAVPREDIIGKVIWEFSPSMAAVEEKGEIRDSLKEDVGKALSGKSATSNQQRLFPDGQYRHIRRTFVPDFAEDGRVRGAFALTTDITDLIKREEQLQRARDKATENEQRLRRVTDNLPGSVFQRVMHPDGTLTYPFANQGLSDIMPFDPDDIEGGSKRLLEMVHPDDREMHREAIERSAETLEPFSLDFRLYAIDGTLRWIRTSSRPRKLDDGSIEWFGVSIDITEQKRAESALQESEERYRTLMELLPEGVVVSNHEEIIYANTGAALLHGAASPKDLIGRSYVDFVHPDYRGEMDIRRMHVENSDARTPVAEHVHLRLDNNQEVVVEKTGQRVPWGGDKATMIVIRDVTERKRQEQALQESEHRYRTLMELLPDAVVVTMDGKVVFSNTLANRLHGAKKPEGLVGMEFIDLVHPDNREEVLLRRFDLVDHSRSLPVVEHRHIRQDTGEEMVVEKTGQRISWQGQPAALVVVRDISERRRMEAALRENEGLLRLITDNVPALIAYLEPDGRYRYVSKQYEDWFGVSRETLIGQVAWDFLVSNYEGADRERIRRILREELEEAVSGNTVKVDSERNYPGGKRRFVRKIMIPDLREDEKPHGVFSMISDISELKRQEEDLRAARDEAEQANRSKSRFLASASHDLRQPLQALNLLSFALSESVVSEEDKHLVYDMRNALSVMESVLNGLIDISKLDAGVVTPEIHDVPLESLCDQLRASFEVQAKQKGLELRLMPCDYIVHTDPDLLSRILDNLTSNAIKYTDSGRILIGARRRGNKLRLEVHDSGQGIPSDELDRIFEEFYQLDNPVRDRNKGLGLGLAIVERTARLLDYPIDAHSHEGVGSVFSVTIPLSGEAEFHEEDDVPVSTVPGDLSGNSILIIEDDDTVRAATHRILQRWGARVAMAASFDEAMERVSDDGFSPDLIVADYSLDGHHTGTGAITAIRERLGYQVAGIIITGDIAAERVTEAQQGDMEVLHKPVDPLELRRLIGSLIEDALM